MCRMRMERMTAHQTLENYLRTPATRVAPDVALTVRSIASACTRIARIVALGPLAGALGAARGGNADGDVQKELDIIANDTVIDALQNAPVANLISEELDEPIRLRTGAPLDVAIDPMARTVQYHCNPVENRWLPATASTARIPRLR